MELCVFLSLKPKLGGSVIVSVRGLFLAEDPAETELISSITA